MGQRMNEENQEQGDEIKLFLAEETIEAASMETESGFATKARYFPAS